MYRKLNSTLHPRLDYVWKFLNSLLLGHTLALPIGCSLNKMFLYFQSVITPKSREVHGVLHFCSQRLNHNGTDGLRPTPLHFGMFQLRAHTLYNMVLTRVMIVIFSQFHFSVMYLTIILTNDTNILQLKCY